MQRKIQYYWNQCQEYSPTPLTYVEDNQDGMTYTLCPSHLINGRRITSMPTGGHSWVVITKASMARRARHHHHLHHFTTKWRKIYLLKPCLAIKVKSLQWIQNWHQWYCESEKQFSEPQNLEISKSQRVVTRERWPSKTWNNLEQYSHCECIEISGIPEVDDEKTQMILW